MAEFNNDLEYWREKYPFLDDIWNLHNVYYEPVTDDTSIQTNVDLCEKELEISPENKGMYNDFCKKLIRNWFLCKVNKSDEDSPKCCYYLHHWLYFERKQWKLSDVLIEKIFKLHFLKNMIDSGELCPYLSIDEDLITDEDLIDLYVFNYNNEILKGISKIKIDSDYCKFKRFISNCIKKYKTEIVKFYHKVKLNSLCDQDIPSYLKLFRDKYSELTRIKTKYGNIPTLDSNDIDKFFSCSSIDIDKLDSFTINTDRSTTSTDCSTIYTTPAVIGILAGIFSLLGLTYKVGMHLI
ncbi:hypothetical protein PCYB_007680 [Plasmodium cynomolgi strain B]|uniref:CYIR protein n=1 Tax=Plasmodium cynomolgi (strain B) TaxID=1120755 RepID=K6V113_PLACD|nr:hypothetical protein PCYB_007680 [Plasmodium cynomolgi strain B]GAB70019.1 hypothetical protein PCYB_007680 [Plasmodium cynomolgi strain B]